MINKKQKKLAQVFLDCGQRNWGQVLCPKCGLLYVPGVQEDTQQHEKVCRPIALGVLWRGTAGKLIQRLPNNNNSNNNNDCIHLILPSSKKSYSSSSQAALTAIFQIVANDLGMEPHSMLQQQQQGQHSCLLYLRDQRVVGVATVEPISTAYRMRNLYERDEVPSKALLGIAVLWTHPTVRHQGIATRLIDAARAHAIFGLVVPKSQVAFSSPTQAGWAFGKEYCGTSGGGEPSSATATTSSMTTPLVYVYQLKSITTG
jgi:GNAT superfamily N-acetyltransferase